jgi:hypothetical protein
MGKRLRRSVLAAVLAVTALALFYTFVLLCGALLSTPSRFTGYTGNVLVGTDGRTLTIDGVETGTSCYETAAPVVTESRQTVALGIKYTTRPAPHSDLCVAGPTETLSVQLSQPLGNRRLVDRATRAPLGSFDESRLLHPRPPAGYQLFATLPYGAGTGPAGAIQRWESTTGHGELTLVQIDGGTLAAVGRGNSDPHQSTPPLLVRGHPATQFATPGAVAWTENGEAMLLTWSRPDPQPTAAAVIAIADSSP